MRFWLTEKKQDGERSPSLILPAAGMEKKRNLREEGQHQDIACFSWPRGKISIVKE